MESLAITENFLNFRRNGNLEIDPDRVSIKHICQKFTLDEDNSSKKEESDTEFHSIDLNDTTLTEKLNPYADIIFKRLPIRSDCEQFSSFEDIAYNIVDEILDTAADHIRLR